MKCPLQQRRCGGCSRLSVPYENQLKFKTEKTRALFPCAKFILGMAEPVHYRNKVISAFAFNKSGLISGMYAYGTHYVLPIDECLLENKRADEIVCATRDILSAYKIKAYDENKKTGLLRFVVVRYAQATGQALVTLVTANEQLHAAHDIAAQIKKTCPDVRTVVQNINPRVGSAVLGFQEHILLGDGVIEDILCGQRLLISSRSFYQVNSSQAAVLYQKALDMTQLSPNDTVVDAYCGIGVIGMIAAQRVKKVIGIELNAEAIRMAKKNAALNHLNNIEFLQGDAGKILPTLKDTPDAVLLDPPRSGCDEAFLSALCTLSPKKICYISCNVTTQKRDIDILEKYGYCLLSAQPVDMFPHTEHIETVVLLSKGEIDSKKVRVEFSLENMDMSGCQKGATYPQIKAYVQET